MCSGWRRGKRGDCRVEITLSEVTRQKLPKPTGWTISLSFTELSLSWPRTILG